ncbi:hypothetical protein Ahy_A04g020068 isoform C [Arachis hypogaea]|uniref:Uncharacterized protein n=1 Tax=Arachis hypogaea TaxID=3818 RepID=A0A445DH19_ARAHY|nr:hypothetical protein Ahy_A04g020068 isoform C [Arachis hypogaea]
MPTRWNHSSLTCQNSLLSLPLCSALHCCRKNIGGAPGTTVLLQVLLSVFTRCHLLLCSLSLLPKPLLATASRRCSPPFLTAAASHGPLSLWSVILHFPESMADFWLTFISRHPQ